MANYTNFDGTQQPREDWEDFAQNSISLPYGLYQTTFDPPVPDPFAPEQPISAQNGIYNPIVNDYMLLDNTGGQSDANVLPLDDAELSTCAESIENFEFNHQLGSNLLATFDMSNASSSLDVSTEPAESTVTETQLRCRFPDCSEEHKFSTESALRKHKDKHNKPYTCHVPGCKYPRFGDKGGLDRHKREVHGSKTHCCPIATCRRHTKGFPRKYNLFEHQKRCHPGQSPTTMAVIRTSQNLSAISAETQDSSEEALLLEVMGTMEVTGNGGGRLREKLERLLTVRAELDSDIEALKRTLDILGDSSP